MANSELTQYLAADNNPAHADRRNASKQPSSSNHHDEQSPPNESTHEPPPTSETTTQSRARWKLLSKAVKSKQFQRPATTSGHESGYQSDLQPSTSSTSSTSSSVPQTPELSDCSTTDSPGLAHASPKSTSLGLVQAYNLMSYAQLDSTWITCSWNPRLLQSPLELFFKFVPPNLTVQDLAGFDNSGNVRLWPCEELLAYLVYGPLQSHLRGTKVVELGAGMTALAGLVAIALDLTPEIYLTDGNDRCVANIGEVVQRNYPWTVEFPLPKVVVQKLRWEVPEDYRNLVHQIESIICADCLFVRRHHRDLLETLDRLLIKPPNHHTLNAPIGTCYILAPKRGKTMTEFTDLVRLDDRFQYRQYDQFDGAFTEWYSNGGPFTSEVPYLLVIRRKCSPPFDL